MQVSNTSDIKPTNINALIYGQSGVGKTFRASTLTGKTLLISMESGLLSLKDKKIDYIEVKGKEKVKELSKILEEIEKSDYENIYIDSLTEISQAFYELSQQKYTDESQTLKRFGYVKEITIAFIKKIRDLNKNIFVTALEKVDKDEVGRRFLVPDLIGSVASTVPVFFDFVFYLKIVEREDQKHRLFITQPIDGCIAKDRSGKLEVYEKPDLQNIINKVFKEKN